MSDLQKVDVRFQEMVKKMMFDFTNIDGRRPISKKVQNPKKNSGKLWSDSCGALWLRG
jgi:hypothetical protein